LRIHNFTDFEGRFKSVKIFILVIFGNFLPPEVVRVGVKHDKEMAL